MRNIIYWIKKVKSMIGFLLFLLLLMGLFSKITYLFRNVSYDRNHVVGIKSEDNNIDVVYIGGSATFVYWEPLKAFKDCGFTSYNLATNRIGVESILPYIKYAEQYNNPKLYVIGIRAFQYYSDEQNEQGIRNSSDGMDLTLLPRYELIYTYLNNRDLDEDVDKVSYYLDIAKYHTNYSNLSNPLAWGFINNNGESEYKGCELKANWAYMDTPEDFNTNKKTELLPNAQKELDRILNYCDEKGLDVLFVVCPYSITKEQYAIYNNIADQVISHGYEFLNANDYYEEMDIDFSRDFYNASHVNVYGAEKYTKFLETYILNKYVLPDHREDSEYVEWNKALVEFENHSNQLKKGVDKMISEAKSAVNQGKEIRDTEAFAEWCSYVNDRHYSLLITGNGKALLTDSTLEKKCLQLLGIKLNELFGTTNYINIIADETSQTNIPEITDSILTVPVGQKEKKVDVTINNQKNACSIIIGNKEYSRQDSSGLNIVVFDNYYRTIIDSVTLKKNQGKIKIVR